MKSVNTQLSYAFYIIAFYFENVIDRYNNPDFDISEDTTFYTSCDKYTIFLIMVVRNYIDNELSYKTSAISSALKSQHYRDCF